MVSSQFSYFLKSYLWTASFTIKEVSKMTGLSPKRIEQILNNQLPNPEEVVTLINKLKLDKTLTWTAFFNSVLLDFHQEPNVVLRDYNNFKTMLLNNKKYRKQFKHNSIPSDEVWVDLLPEDFSLNDITLASKIKYGLHIKLDKKNKAILAKDFSLTLKRLDEIVRGQIPTEKELTNIYFSQKVHPFGDSVLRAYISQVNKKLKLGFKIDYLNERSYLNLLDKIDFKTNRTKKGK